MKILVVSDTHGELEYTKSILRRHKDVDKKLHLGDIGFPAEELRDFCIVRGNHDHDLRLPKELIFPLEKRKAICLHGHLFDEAIVSVIVNRKDASSMELMDLCLQALYKRLAAYAKQQGCDTLFFGHTHHRCFLEMDGVVLINPGSVFLGTPQSGYALVEVHGHDIRMEYVS